MTGAELLLEIGATAYGDLSAAEITAITGMFTAAQARLAGMKAFELLMKNFQADYKMGRAYEGRSKKYEHYRKIFNWYASTTSAGKITGTDSDMADYNPLDRWKFTADDN